MAKRPAQRRTPVRARSAARGSADPRNPGFVESSDALTTNQGLPIADNQNSLKLGERGPTLLEDFILREKITHFDHERIPERIVHARGSGAHGTFQVYRSMAKITKAGFLQDPKLKTPVFVRFSTVLGGAGSADTVRDVRGFAVKFYTQQGNYDLVGNNIPVFFIQDAIKFPDLVHAAKPEPHHFMPQAASAHDTFWDFVSLMPESMHMLMWAMSDRAIPRSYRMMQGFGVHSFKLVNADGVVHFVKFHWRPLLGVHSLVWEEAQQIAGKDADFHRRDLWEAIESGAFPEYELGVQLIPEADVEDFPIDLLDPTKLVPEEMVPVTPVGRLVLDRNPDNFFTQTEQVAFHPGHLVPGIDFTPDPLLQGRLFSYTDTQLSRLGSANFHELPINQPKCPMHNLQRDGHMRHTVAPGRVSYEPSSLDEGAPAQVAPAHGGFETAPEVSSGPRIRVRPGRFFDHFSQATLFWRSQTPVEQDHIASAFRFELGKVETAAVKQRMVDLLQNVDPTLAEGVAKGVGLKVGKPPRSTEVRAPIDVAPSLSILRGQPQSAASRKVAVLCADGVSSGDLRIVRAALEKAGATCKIVAPHGGTIRSDGGESVPVDHALETVSSTLFDGVTLPGGPESVSRLLETPGAVTFVLEAFRHRKAIGGSQEAAGLLGAGGLDAEALGAEGLVFAGKARIKSPDVEAFVTALACHRHWARAVPPRLGP